MAGIGSLPLFHRVAGQPVIVLGEGPEADAKARLVERAGGLVFSDMQAGIDHGARLAFIALDTPQDCEAAAIRLRCAGLLVNVVDQPELCDFTTPSILDRDPVLVAVGTGGASAGLAKHVRLRLERILPPGLGRLASALFEAREALRQRYPDGADRRRALDAALQEGGRLDPLVAGSEERVASWLAGDAEAPPAQVETIVLTSPDPDELTLRAARLLGQADCVIAESGIPGLILDRARADAIRLHDAADTPENARLTVRLTAGWLRKTSVS